MEDKILITCSDGSSFNVLKNTSIIEIIELFDNTKRKDIIGVKINNEVFDMNTKLKKNTYLEFINSSDLIGYRMMQAGLKFVLEVAIKDLYGKSNEIIYNHSIMRGIHCSVIGDIKLTNEDVLKIKEEMIRIVNDDMPITKLNIASKEAISYFEKVNEREKANNILNVSNAVVSLYKLNNYINYFYVDMPYSTGCLTKFDLVYLDNNDLVLSFPTPRSKEVVPEHVNYAKVIDCFKKEKEWLVNQGIPYVCDVNEKVASGKIDELIRISEINYNNKLHQIALDAVNSGAKFILVAGPSSSGKTTTTKKLALSLEAMGINTLQLSTDDFYKDREDCPKNPDGSYDFEGLEALDIDLFNNVLNDLLNGKSVKLPTLNFITGHKEYNKEEVSLKDNMIILIEGLHCLNDELTPNINSKLKYKVYLSPFMPLNIDKHNYISTSDLRMIRRIIRDNRTRGTDVSKTISTWQSVRGGEDKYIFPYINQASVILNTSLVYELGVLKVFAEPLLYSVRTDSIYYEEARRLISFLKGYFPISSEYINNSCVLREFIGGSIFE